MNDQKWLLNHEGVLNLFLSGYFYPHAREKISAKMHENPKLAKQILMEYMLTLPELAKKLRLFKRMKELEAAVGVHGSHWVYRKWIEKRLIQLFAGDKETIRRIRRPFG